MPNKRSARPEIMQAFVEGRLVELPVVTVELPLWSDQWRGHDILWQDELDVVGEAKSIIAFSCDVLQPKMRSLSDVSPWVGTVARVRRVTVDHTTCLLKGEKRVRFIRLRNAEGGGTIATAQAIDHRDLDAKTVKKLRAAIRDYVDQNGDADLPAELDIEERDAYRLLFAAAAWLEDHAAVRAAYWKDGVRPLAAAVIDILTPKGPHHPGGGSTPPWPGRRGGPGQVKLLPRRAGVRPGRGKRAKLSAARALGLTAVVRPDNALAGTSGAVTASTMAEALEAAGLVSPLAGWM